MRPGDTLPSEIDFHPDAEYVRGFDDGWSDREALTPLSFRGFGVGIIVGMILGVVLMFSGVPR